VRDRIESLDAVERARVRALASGVLEIRAIERVPVVVWRSAGGLELLDQNGVRVAEVDSRVRRPDLPLIAGEGAETHVPEALALLAETRPVAERVRGLVRVGERRWDLVLDRGQVVKLPEADPVLALRRVMGLDKAEQLLARDLGVVDMRDPSRPMLRLTEHAISELERLRAGDKGEDA
jgi:cell division protein FtsQ